MEDRGSGDAIKKEDIPTVDDVIKSKDEEFWQRISDLAEEEEAETKRTIYLMSFVLAMLTNLFMFLLMCNYPEPLLWFLPITLPLLFFMFKVILQNYIDSI